MGGADWVGHGIQVPVRRLHAMGVLARRLVCYIETGDVPSQPSAGNTHRGLSSAIQGLCSSLLLDLI
jgi:hypothetical protein